MSAHSRFTSYEEALAAHSEPSDELARSIQLHVRTRLSAYHYPRPVEFVPSLPKTLTGKIRRIELREAEARRVAGGAGSSPPAPTL